MTFDPEWTVPMNQAEPYSFAEELRDLAFRYPARYPAAVFAWRSVIEAEIHVARIEELRAAHAGLERLGHEDPEDVDLAPAPIVDLAELYFYVRELTNATRHLSLRSEPGEYGRIMEARSQLAALHQIVEAAHETEEAG